MDRVDDLVAAGVASLKIEGRMKSPEYVFAVTQTYRAVLDRTLAERAAGSGKDVRAAEDEHRTLAEAFSPRVHHGLPGEPARQRHHELRAPEQPAACSWVA